MSWISLECVLIAFLLLSFTHMHAGDIFGEKNFFREIKHGPNFSRKGFKNVSCETI